jgi:hypothetical protein
VSRRFALVARGLLVTYVLDRIAAPRGRSRRRLRGEHPPAATTAVAAPRRGPLLTAMLGCFAVGLPLMVLFEGTITRILGVALMFGFIVTGVFLIANPAFLSQEDE